MERMVELCGRIDSSNAGKLEEALLAEYEKHGAIVLDANELEYISSAGLRVLLKLRKKQGCLEVRNVSTEVNEIFEVTGFSDMLTIRKKLRQVSVDNCELIGKGGNGSVYRISEDASSRSIPKGHRSQALRVSASLPEAPLWPACQRRFPMIW